MVLRLRQHNIGYMADGFYRSNDPTNSVKHWRRVVSHPDRPQSNQAECFTSPPTQYRLYRRRFLQVKRPNQQYQSTEGESCKGKQPKNRRKKTQITHVHTQNSIHVQHTQINTASPLVYNYMGRLGDGSHRGQGCQAWTAVGLPPWYPPSTSEWVDSLGYAVPIPFMLVHAGKYSIQYRRQMKNTDNTETIHNPKNKHKTQQNKTTLVTTLGQETRWAYSTMLRVYLTVCIPRQNSNLLFGYWTEMMFVILPV